MYLRRLEARYLLTLILLSFSLMIQSKENSDKLAEKTYSRIITIKNENINNRFEPNPTLEEIHYGAKYCLSFT